MPIPFNQESWVWYTIAMLLIAARAISRYILFSSFRLFKFDDWLMSGFVTVCYTTLVVAANKWLKAQSNLEPPGFDFSTLNDSELALRRYGSQMMVIIEQMLVIVIWTCKACLLIMYYRITRTALRNENRAIIFLSIYVAANFILMELLYFGVWCRPFSQYYAVPTHSRQCDTLIDHRITKATFNISSDIVMLGIALRMLIRSLLPMKRKLVLCGIFSLGIFIVISSIASAYYSLKYPYSQTWLIWYIREASTAVVVANLPFTWTVLKNIFELDDFRANTPAPWSYHPSSRKISKTTHISQSSRTMTGGSLESTHKLSRWDSDETDADSVLVTRGESLDAYNSFAVKSDGSFKDEKAVLADETSTDSPTSAASNIHFLDIQHNNNQLSKSHSCCDNKDISGSAYCIQSPPPLHLTPPIIAAHPHRQQQ